MDYKDMIEHAVEHGVSKEEAMWAGVHNVSSLLESIRDDCPDAYWRFMRRSYEDLYGEHYNRDFAQWDVSQMHSTDNAGIAHKGEHWTVDEVITATQGKAFPKSVTDWDRYVAYNAMWHDLHKIMSDAEILEVAYLYFFADDDYKGSGKIWRYMTAMKR